MLIFQLEVCQKGEFKKGVLGRRSGLPTRDIEDLVIPEVMNDVFYPKEDILKILC